MNILRNERIIWILLTCLLGILLFPIIFYPEVSDVAIYYQGGQVLLNGKLYVDFIDVKSPLLFAFFSFIGSLTGKSVVLIRFVEFLMHLFTSLLIYNLMKKYFNQFISFSSATLYAISIILINFPGTFQAETISNIFIILIISALAKIYVDKNNLKLNSQFIYLGIFTGILASIKISYLILPISVLLIELFHHDFKELRWKKFLFLIIGFISTFIASHLILIDGEILKGYLKSWEYTIFYSRIPAFDSGFIRFVIKEIGNYFGYYNTLLLTLSGSLAVYYFLRNDKTTNWEFVKSQRLAVNYTEKIDKFLLILSILLISLLFTVIYERKLFTYHFSRIFVPLVIFESIGFYIIIKNVFLGYYNNSLYKKAIIIIVTAFLLFTSPLFRIVQQWQYPLKKLQGNEKYYKFIDGTGNFTYCYSDKLKMSEHINTKFPKNTKILMASNGSYDIMFHLNGNVINTFAQSTFYICSKKIEGYEEKFIRELNETDLLIIQKTDNYYLLNRHNLSTYDWIKTNPKTSEIIFTKFEISKELPGLILYQAKKY